MTTTDIVKDLDAALAYDPEDSTDFAEEYPDASQQTIETAKQIEVTRAKIEQLEELAEQKQQRQKAQLQAVEDALAASVKELKQRVAAMAVNHGTATEEEKQLVKEARAANSEQYSDLDDLSKFLAPQGDPETQT